MDLSKVFAALADDSRRKVIAELATDPEDQERACGSFDLPVKKATRTHHFRVLREAGLVVQRDHGNGSTLRLLRTDIEESCPGLLQLLVAELSQSSEGKTKS
ncbi:DNA-binding transcriptional ArsR family regulator [Streptomyces africanus]|uniref:DNA-binding transcriptional ArsR family regulator n=1 Tax=Streptomyces africanus TaxID=231024 RepID=A0ABU0R2X6_9ACTN|nr:helix-turn-helix domain-containing protein [Streptomyces africanus]MDQ0745772.1 DNA-binding transcriptional ArsR family regulator [Streptomyces africanus]MDQ0754011.1 DNA-binding transcriptional ArsR family regulator [Streptomyces africanus]